MATQNDVKLFSDRFRVIERVAQYGLSIDCKDWGLFRLITAHQITLEVRPTYGAGFPPSMTNEEWLTAIQGVTSSFLATHHVITNHIVSISGDEAECRSLLTGSHFYKTASGETAAYVTSGRYAHYLVRKNGDWLIKGLLLEIIAETDEPPFKREMENGIATAKA